MSSSTPPETPNGFDEILGVTTTRTELANIPDRRGRVVVATITGAGLVGVAVLAVAILTSMQAGSLVPPSAATTSPPVERRAVPAAPVEETVATAPSTVSIADLADGEWTARVADRSGIPPRALTAYAGAALRIAEKDAGCGLGWNTLAAIGHVETHHGTIHGASVDSDGLAKPTIVGIALDGTRTDQIADTDGGELDGDSAWDRAVGPMQFIPGTWAEYGRDGNGDGILDVNNIDDAALAAGEYLCGVGGDLTVSSNWIAAIGAYNSSIEYNNKVASAANHYASLY
jgi:membrane-bound lytic murein transglycosylase B